jgi:hypothetical protein
LDQPDDTTCGPTSLHAVYQYYGHDLPLQKVIAGVQSLSEGGTIAVNLGLHALGMGYRAAIYTYNLKVFDPSWKSLSPPELVAKLQAQKAYKKGLRFSQAVGSYCEFLEKGGEIRFQELRPELLYFFLDQEIPILTGLSATYLYDCPRERTNSRLESVFDDLRGLPTGHFVLLHHRETDGLIHIADPYKENPLGGANYYTTGVQKLINSIMLGIMTYDANLLILHPKEVPWTNY